MVIFFFILPLRSVYAVACRMMGTGRRSSLGNGRRSSVSHKCILFRKSRPSPQAVLEALAQLPLEIGSRQDGLKINFEAA